MPYFAPDLCAGGSPGWEDALWQEVPPRTRLSLTPFTQLPGHEALCREVGRRRREGHTGDSSATAFSSSSLHITAVLPDLLRRLQPPGKSRTRVLCSLSCPRLPHNPLPQPDCPHLSPTPLGRLPHQAPCFPAGPRQSPLPTAARIPRTLIPSRPGPGDVQPCPRLPSHLLEFHFAQQPLELLAQGAARSPRSVRPAGVG